jgi:hypothetical protein
MDSGSMITLHKNDGDPLSESVTPPPAGSSLLPPRDRNSLLAMLSSTKRNALIACFNAGALHKNAGAWHGALGGKPVAGTTIADLSRDGMLTVTTNRRLGSAYLTERGNWFAQALIHGGSAK